MIPVEKMAARLLSRHKLQPPYDLDALVEKYGSVEYLRFPFNADGVTLGIGGQDRPQVLINKSIPKTRQVFTLAHELGHIIIPWHTGTIVSHIGATQADNDYREMESEANEFAAELLVPASWLLELQQSVFFAQKLFETVLENSGVSRDAALIKIFNTLTIPMLCVQIDSNGDCIKQYRTSSAPFPANTSLKNLTNESVFSTANTEELFSLGDRRYKSWIFDCRTSIVENDRRSWREILTQILSETGSEGLLASVNAVLGSGYHSLRRNPEAEICARILQKYDTRAGFKRIVAHPLFPQYVVKRVKELKSRQKA